MPFCDQQNTIHVRPSMMNNFINMVITKILDVITVMDDLSDAERHVSFCFIGRNYNLYAATLSRNQNTNCSRTNKQTLRPLVRLSDRHLSAKFSANFLG
jgi:hypothetical protein